MSVISIRSQLFVLCFTLSIAAGGLFIPVPSSVPEVRLTLHVAAGCRKLITDLAREMYGGPNHGVMVETGSTRMLAKRIERGRIPDILIAAGDREIDRLAGDGLIDPETATPLLDTPLVIVISGDASYPLHSTLHLLSSSVRSIAICTPDTEVGRTTVEALKMLGLWFKVLHRIRTCQSAEIAISRVQRGEVDAAIVFGPDVLDNKKVQVIQDAFPAGSYTPVRYTAYLMKNAPDLTAACRFLDHLRTPKAQERIKAFRAGNSPPVPVDWWARIWAPLLLSLRAACLALMVVFPLALCTAAYLARNTSVLSKVVAALATMPLVVPPVVVGCGLMFLFSRNGPVVQATGLPLAFTWQAGALAAGIMSFPLAVRPMQSAFEAVNPQYLKVARTLGGSRFYNFLLISLPLGGKGLAAGVILAFTRAFGEFGATLVVAGNIPGLTRMLPQALYTEFETGNSSLALGLMLAFVAFSFLMILAYGQFEIRRKGP